MTAVQDNYMLVRYGLVTQTAGKIKRKFVKTAVPAGERLCPTVLHNVSIVTR
jgi:hypothetical protein